MLPSISHYFDNNPCAHITAGVNPHTTLLQHDGHASLQNGRDSIQQALHDPNDRSKSGTC